MNLKEGKGKIPIRTEGETPWLLIDWITREQFDEMYSFHSPERREILWLMLTIRGRGATLSEAGRIGRVTRERMRQIEAKFQRRVGLRWKELNS